MSQRSASVRGSPAARPSYVRAQDHGVLVAQNPERSAISFRRGALRAGPSSLCLPSLWRCTLARTSRLLKYDFRPWKVTFYVEQSPLTTLARILLNERRNFESLCNRVLRAFQ